MTVRGNYDHHDYHGGWSQGFNFDFMSYSTDLLIEHNVIRSGSWPVQDLSGIFRYNLVVEIGHTWLRTASSGTRIHHNVFLHPGDQLGPNAGVDAGILFYQDEQGIEIYNNTFDAGGTSSQMLAPILTVSGNARVGSFYNNVVTGFMTQAPRGLVAREAASASGSRIDFADYNVFYNPLTNSPHYETGTVVSGLGAHDVDTNPRFAIGSQIPYAIDEKQVWSGALRVSQVLAHYRELYTPAVGSPLIDAGGPAGLAGVDIGAIEGESGAQRPEDLFGKFGARTDTLPPRPPSHLFVQ
jgi:hypothetical protein